MTNTIDGTAKFDLLALARQMRYWRKLNGLTQRECDEMLGFDGLWGGIERLYRCSTNDAARREYGALPRVDTIERVCQLCLADEPLTTFWNLWGIE